MINIGKIKIGPKYRKFLWGHYDFSKDDLPSTTTVIISKNEGKRKSIMNDIEADGIKIIHLDISKISKIIDELKKEKEIIKNRLTKESTKERETHLICLDDYDLLMYNDNTTEINQIKSLINYINDYGKRVDIFLLLGCNALNTRFIESIDNIILVPPYNLSYLNLLFKDSIYEIINETHPIEQFCKINGLAIDQVTKEPAILKNGNNIYLYREK